MLAQHVVRFTSAKIEIQIRQILLPRKDRSHFGGVDASTTFHIDAAQNRRKPADIDKIDRELLSINSDLILLFWYIFLVYYKSTPKSIELNDDLCSVSYEIVSLLSGTKLSCVRFIFSFGSRTGKVCLCDTIYYKKTKVF